MFVSQVLNISFKYIRFVNDKELMKMTKQKRGRGRPIGGKHPAVMREYWREMQRMSRATRKEKAVLRKVTGKR
jgi:hypothetical protein